MSCTLGETGVSNFQALNFILVVLIENDLLELLLRKFSSGDPSTVSASEASTGFRMAVLTALEQLRPDDLDASIMVSRSTSSIIIIIIFIARTTNITFLIFCLFIIIIIVILVIIILSLGFFFSSSLSSSCS